jgi:hypothetical protein
MTRYLLDTNTIGHYLDRRRGVAEKVREARAQGAVIGTCMPVVAYQGGRILAEAGGDRRLREGL